MRAFRTPRGIRFVHGGHVVTEVLARPGPTHSVFDVLAGCVAALSPGDQLAMLGFAGGGMVAPLRALGRDDAIRAVDLDLRPFRTFRRLTGTWSGDVRVRHLDAAAFLVRERQRYPCIIEDLSVQRRDGEVHKPELTYDVLPGLIARRLERTGTAIFNLFAHPNRSWTEAYARIHSPFAELRVVHLDAYENRILLAGRHLPGARQLQQTLTAALALIGSRLAGTLTVRRVAARQGANSFSTPCQ